MKSEKYRPVSRQATLHGASASMRLILIFAGVLLCLAGRPAYAEGSGAGPGRGSAAEVIDVYAGMPIIDAGLRDGVRRGDEFTLISSGAAAGDGSESSGGLLVVKRADDRVAETAVRYGPRKIEEGTGLEKVRRLGADFTGYVRYTQPVLGDAIIKNEPQNTEGIVTAGMRVTVSRGFYSLRPLFAVETPFDADTAESTDGSGGAGGFPVRMYAGGEVNWYFRRLVVTPSGAVGFCMNVSGGSGETGAAAETEGPVTAAQFGGVCWITFSYLLCRSVSICAEAGGAAWRSMREDTADEIGPFVGFGITIRG